MTGYTALLTATALRSLARLPPRIAEPLLSFIYGSLAENPKRRSHELRNEFSGYRSARRGDYRVLVVLDDEARTMTVMDVGPRATVYRPR
ncbi:type II toxin-antitoxin system RelE family toxin [Sinomonas albida]|uniref:type II toxin-antitoxin system RelE family toxin n=1 Tax=Sinomonas albida TaxID=369942 RepID=UPI0010A77BFF|nr:type II toxin-antitoxin system RelE/ParE family toxin [Sinomonas albida]